MHRKRPRELRQASLIHRPAKQQHQYAEPSAELDCRHLHPKPSKTYVRYVQRNLIINQNLNCEITIVRRCPLTNADSNG